MTDRCEKPKHACWGSVADMLIQNRCWICLNQFPRGKKRKVFMVDNLLEHFEKRLEFKVALEKAKEEGWTLAEDAAGVALGVAHPGAPPAMEPAPAAEEGSSTDAGAASASALPPAPPVYTFTEDELNGIQHLTACWERYQEIGGDQALLEADFKANQVERWMSGLACCRNELCNAVYECIVPPTEADGKPKRFYNDPKDCPPGCGCDNPWPFTGNAVPMVPPKPKLFSGEDK